MPLTRKDLDRLECQHPNCTHEGHEQFYLHSRCHMSSGVFACYDRRNGTVTMECAKCKKPIAVFQVADGS